MTLTSRASSRERYSQSRPGAVPSDGPRLLLVARRAYEWLQPLLYESMTLTFIASQPHSASVAALQAKSPEFITTTLHRVVFNVGGGAAEDALSVLAICDGVSHLALNLHYGAKMRLRDVMQRAPSVRRLAIAGTLNEIFPTPDGQPWAAPEPCPITGFFLHLTHLHFCLSLDFVATTFLCALPALTHLALRDTISAERCDILLRRCASLRVLCLLGYPGYAYRLAQSLASQPVSRDVRLCVCMMRPGWDAVALPDKRTFWDDADDFVAKRRLRDGPVKSLLAVRLECTK
ncbi:hypothetical protein MKEN_01112900 [Mycena kentingensis (nom. inval.)]|nr:hypothetical protein MKEN_01112900 [Mycena kentingensis (nom. inval.)]